MRAHRTLALRKETLTELNTTELAAVFGAQRITALSDFLIDCASLRGPCSTGCPTAFC